MLTFEFWRYASRSRGQFASLARWEPRKNTRLKNCVRLSVPSEGSVSWPVFFIGAPGQSSLGIVGFLRAIGAVCGSGVRRGCPGTSRWLGRGGKHDRRLHSQRRSPHLSRPRQKAPLWNPRGMANRESTVSGVVCIPWCALGAQVAAKRPEGVVRAGRGQHFRWRKCCVS